MSAHTVMWDQLTDAQRAAALRDAITVVDVVVSGFAFKTAGDIRFKLDWPVERMANAVAALKFEGGLDLFG